MKVRAFDTETGGLDWWDPDQQAFLGTWAGADDEHHAVLTAEWSGKDGYVASRTLSAGADEYIKALDEAEVIVGHNLPFDIHQTRETVGYDVLESGAELHDTDLLARVVHPEFRNGGFGGYRLKRLAQVLVDANAADEEDAIKEMAKSIGLRTIKQKGAYREVWRAYPEVMEEYARQDARITYDLFEKLRVKLDDPGLRRIYELEMSVLPILVRAERRGVAVDPVAVNRLKAEYEPALAEVREYLIEELGEAALGGEGSGEALTESLLALGVPLTEKTDSGKLATNKYALQKFAKDYPVIEKLEEFRTLSRFLSTYIGAVEGRDFVHCSFRQFEAWTGRMSCTRPNLQNLPKRAGKEVRAVLVPRPGHAFVVSDYESIEVRLLAYYLNDQGFRDLIAGGHDPHAWMATNIWGGSVEDFAKGGPNDARRALSKNILFAITYGAGAPRVMNMLLDADMPATRDEAKAIISKIKASLPGYYKLQKRIKSKIEDVGYVNTIMGRKNLVKPEKSYVGLNALVQGSAADVMKQGVVNVDAAIRDLDAHVLLVVHDEVVVEVPIDRADECRTRVDAALVAAWPLDPPLSVESSITTTSYADA